MLERSCTSALQPTWYACQCHDGDKQPRALPEQRGFMAPMLTDVERQAPRKKVMEMQGPYGSRTTPTRSNTGRGEGGAAAELRLLRAAEKVLERPLLCLGFFDGACGGGKSRLRGVSAYIQCFLEDQLLQVAHQFQHRPLAVDNEPPFLSRIHDVHHRSQHPFHSCCISDASRYQSTCMSRSMASRVRAPPRQSQPLAPNIVLDGRKFGQIL